MYLLARGAAYVLTEVGEREKVVDELGSGQVFGEIAMLAGERRTASIRTATASVLVRIPPRGAAAADGVEHRPAPGRVAEVRRAALR
jgi:hypothetical protein